MQKGTPSKNILESNQVQDQWPCTKIHGIVMGGESRQAAVSGGVFGWVQLWTQRMVSCNL